MKKKLFLLGNLFCCTMAFTACDDEIKNGKNDEPDTDPVLTEVINDYVDNVIFPTYTEMKEKAWTLSETVHTFVEEGTQLQLDAVCSAWRTLRVPWEESEAFLFGPVDFKKIDPSLDDWPLDQVAINQQLNSGADISYEFLRGGLASNVRGFHTIEYLIFENGQPKKVSSLNDRQKEYLLSITQLLRDDCIKVFAYWNGETGINERDRKVLDEIEFDFEAYKNGYASFFKTPNMSNVFNFKTQTDVLNQIVDGCIDICSEVREQKIGNPYDTKNVYAVESWYSWNSLTDYENNIISIENSYFGGREKNRGHSISDYVKSKNVDLDTEIKNKMTAARTAIRAIPAPFRNNLNADTEIKAAQTALASLEGSLLKLKTLW